MSEAVGTTVQQALSWGSHELSFHKEVEVSASLEAVVPTASGCPILRSSIAKGGSEDINHTSTLDARILLQYTLGKNQAWILAHCDDSLDDLTINKYQSLINRRKANEPIQYITGEQEFYGIPLRVTPAVLIPRPETEHLVEAALKILAGLPAGSRLLDVGTGSGAIVVPIALSSPSTRITAVDLSPDALEVARGNLTAHNLTHRVRLLESDLLSAVTGEEFEVIVSNPPYVAETNRDTLDAQVRDFEPSLALFAGADGLAIYRALIPAAAKSLVHGGWLLLEIGAGQSSSIQQLLEHSGLAEIRFIEDLQMIPRVAVAQKN